MSSRQSALQPTKRQVFPQGRVRQFAAIAAGIGSLWFWNPVAAVAARSVHPAIAQVTQPTRTMTPQAALERLLNAEPIAADWFAPEFLAQVPIAQIQQILTNVKAELGAYRRVQPDGSNYQIEFERGWIPTQIALNDRGQIAGLLFQPSRWKASQLSDVVTELKALPGQVSLLVLEGKTERAALNPATPLAVGSSFKLAVLQALKQQVESGQRSWQDIIPLQSNWKSLPSGFLHTWPEGSVLTLQSLAALMISQSDNTATDHLIHTIGRSEIEALTARNRPFLTTREAFILKSSNNQALRKQYQAGNESQQRSLLTEIAKQPLPALSDFKAGPISPEIEWFFTTQELCTLMQQVHDLPLMRINPGVANASEWERVAFKGGSEPGVINLTTWLQAKSGKQYCVSATWNQQRVLDESRFFALYGRLLGALK